MFSTLSEETGRATAGQAPGHDAPVPLPNISIAFVIHSEWRGNGLPDTATSFIVRTVQGDDTLKGHCGDVVRAVADRLEKHLVARGVDAHQLDAVVVDFFDYVFRHERRSLEDAWNEYREIYFDERDRWVV